MAIRPLLQYRNPDSTLDLNTTQARIVDRTIFDGGTLTLSGSALQVSVAPFIAAGYDGMVAISDASETRTVPAPAAAGPNRVSYLVLHLEYRSLTAPIFNLQVIPETTWLTSVSRNYFITFASFSVPFGATSLTDPGVVVNYAVGDWGDKLGKTGWRLPVATAASLPTVGNRDGDVRVALDTRFAYQWNSTTSLWSPIGGAVDLAEVFSRNGESRAQWHRATSGSGLVNEIPQSLNAPAGGHVSGDAVRDTEIPIQFPFIPVPGTANTGQLPGCHFLINGHFVKTRARNLTFATPPVTGERFDLLLLEVYRVAVSIPANVTYDNELGVPQTFAAVRTALEGMLEQGAAVDTSYDLSEMDIFAPSSFVATAYQYRIISNVNVSVLTDSSSVAASINNVDGNAFSVGTNTDQKVWKATAATSSVDGVSWAIPLLVVRRTDAELAGPPFIDTFRDGERFIFDVCPRAELGMGLFEMEASVENYQSALAQAKLLQLPSGFLKGTDDPIGINSGSLSIPEGVVHILGQNLFWEGSVSVSLPAAPATSARTDVLVLEVFKTIHPPPLRDAEGVAELSHRSRIGLRNSQWIGKFTFRSLPLGFPETDVAAAMTATTLYSPVSGEPVLWSRASTPLTGEDPVNSVYALPVCLVHRRNTGAFALTVNGQNGADRSAFPGVPNQSAEFPYAGEVLDARSKVIVSSDELKHTLDKSFDALIAGDLRTIMRTHPVAANVTGTQLLQVDQICATPTLGTYQLPQFPNGHQTVWAESDEVELITWSFSNMDTNHSDPDGVFTWDSATNELTIECPPGYILSLDRRLPLRPYGAGNFIAYTVESGGSGDLRPLIMAPTFLSGAPPGSYVPAGLGTDQLKETVVTLALNGNALYTEAAARVIIGVWMIRKNSEEGRTSVSNYTANNRGLFASPDVVHRIEYSAGGPAGPFTRAWVGAPLNTVEVPVVGDTITIDQTTLFASGSISTQIASAAANLQVYAVVDVSLSSVYYGDHIRYIRFTNNAGTAPAFDRCQLVFNAASIPGGTTAKVTLVCLGDLVDHWFEVDTGSRQVKGPYTIIPTEFTITAADDHVAERTPRGSFVPWFDVGLNPIGGLPAGSDLTAAISPGLLADNSGLFPSGSPLYSTLSFYSAGSAAAAYEIWFNGVDRSPTQNIGTGQSVTVQVSVAPPSTYVVMGGFAPLHTVRYQNSGGATASHGVALVSPVRAPLDSGACVRVWYTYTPYQGITDDLEDYINGTVESLTDQIVFTSGPNLPVVDPRALESKIRLTPAPSFAFVYSGLVEGPSAISADIGLIYSEGRIREPGYRLNSPQYTGWFASEDLARPFKPKDRPPFALSSRLPYPNRPADGASTTYAPEGKLRNSIMLDGPCTRIVHPQVGFARSEADPWTLDYATGSTGNRVWTSAAASKTLYIPLPLSFGEVLCGVTVEVISTSGSGTITADIVTRSRTGTTINSVSPPYSLVCLTPVARSLYEFSVDNTVVSATSTNEVMLRLVSDAAGQSVGSVVISVLPSSITRDRLAHTVRRIPYDDVRDGFLGKTLKIGSVIEVPSTWTTEGAAISALTISNGKEDVASLSPPRGRTHSFTRPNFSLTYGDGLVSYVPGASFSHIRSMGSLSTALSLVGKETPQLWNAKPYSVYVPASNASAVVVGSALPYMVRNSEDSCTMAVTAGYSTVVDGTAAASVGMSIDGFYPIGRPVYRKF